MSVCCECCQVEVSATCWSLVQQSPTDCGVSKVCDRETSKNRRLRPPRGCRAIGEKKFTLCSTLIRLFILQVKVVCETRDIEHANMLKDMLYKNYKDVVFGEIPSPSLLGAENVEVSHHI